MELMCCKKWWLGSAFWVTNVSSTYLNHILAGLVAVLMALVSNSPMDKVDTIGMMGDPIAAPCSCSKYCRSGKMSF